MISVDGAVVQFLDACRADGLKAPTVRWYEGKLRPLTDEYGGWRLPDVKVSDMRAYVRGLYDRKSRYVGVAKKQQIAGGLSTESIRGHIRTLKRFFRWSYDEYVLVPADNPMRGIKMPRAPKPVPKAATPETIQALLRACDSTVEGLRNAALIAFLADTGCRLNGALGLKLAKVNLETRRAEVFEKYDQGRVVGFSHYTAERLRSWLLVRPAVNFSTEVFLALGTNTYGVPMTSSGVHAMLKRLAIKAGVADDRFNPHSFRHGLAHMWIDAGGDASRLAEIMGHSGVAITLSVYGAYLHAQALEKFDELALMDKLMKGGESK